MESDLFPVIKHVLRIRHQLLSASECQLVTTLRTTTGKNETSAASTGTDQKAVRTSTLDLGGLICTLGSHNIFTS